MTKGSIQGNAPQLHDRDESRESFLCKIALLSNLLLNKASSLNGILITAINSEWRQLMQSVSLLSDNAQGTRLDFIGQSILRAICTYGKTV